MSTLVVRGPVVADVLVLPAGVSSLIYYPTNDPYGYTLGVRYAVAPDSDNTLQITSHPKDASGYTPPGSGLFDYAVWLDSVASTYTHYRSYAQSASGNEDFVAFSPSDSRYLDQRLINAPRARMLSSALRFPGGPSYYPARDYTGRGEKQDGIDIQEVDISITRAMGRYPDYVPWPWRITMNPPTVARDERRVRAPSRGVRRYPPAPSPANAAKVDQFAWFRA